MKMWPSDSICWCRGVVVEVVAQIQHDSFFSFHQRSMHLIDLFDRVQGPFRAWFASDDFKGLFDCACGCRGEKRARKNRPVVSAGTHHERPPVHLPKEPTPNTFPKTTSNMVNVSNVLVLIPPPFLPPLPFPLPFPHSSPLLFPSSTSPSSPSTSLFRFVVPDNF